MQSYFICYPPSHQAFLSAPSLDLTEPLSYEAAAAIPECSEVMNKEIQTLVDNHTWDLVDLPPWKKPIRNKWVYKVKLKADGSLDRCKTRLVSKGFNQKYGIDYE